MDQLTLDEAQLCCETDNYIGGAARGILKHIVSGEIGTWDKTRHSKGHPIIEVSLKWFAAFACKMSELYRYWSFNSVSKAGKEIFVIAWQHGFIYAALRCLVTKIFPCNNYILENDRKAGDCTIFLTFVPPHRIWKHNFQHGNSPRSPFGGLIMHLIRKMV